jgi:hypothetical protein
MSEHLKELGIALFAMIAVMLLMGGFILMMNYISYISDGWC